MNCFELSKGFCIPRSRHTLFALIFTSFESSNHFILALSKLNSALKVSNIATTLAWAGTTSSGTESKSATEQPDVANCVSVNLLTDTRPYCWPCPTMHELELQKVNTKWASCTYIAVAMVMADFMIVRETEQGNT